jgi:hypothetical protein
MVLLRFALVATVMLTAMPPGATVRAALQMVTAPQAQSVEAGPDRAAAPRP